MKTLISYALLAMPLAILGLPLYIYLPTFYSSEVGISMALVGIILFIARLTDVISDPFFGYLSDRIQKKFNSRKPLMILGFLLLIISFYYLINPNYEYKEIWLFIFSILVYQAWSMISIPYITWSSEISDNYYEKNKLNSAREVFTIFGLIVAIITPYLFDVSSNLEKSLDILFLLFLLLIIPFFIVSILRIKIIKPNSTNKFMLKDLLKTYNKIPSLKNLHLAYFLNNTANAFPATLFLLYTAVVIKNEDQSGAILILYFLAGLIALPVWTIISKKIPKKSVWSLSILLASTSFIFVPFLGEGDILLFGIISFISGLSLGADISFPTSIHGDVTQKNPDISGVLFGIWSMITKISLALSVAIGFIILDIFQFDKQNPNEFSIYALIFLYSILPVILKLIALIFIRKYKE